MSTNEDIADIELFESPNVIPGDGADGGTGADTPAATEAEQAPVETPDPEKQRYAYWQSQAEKLRAELAGIAPIKKLLEEDPGAALKLQEYLASKGAEPAGPKAPEAPARPHRYDEAEAYQDPSSESFKYRVAKEQYMEDRLRYAEERDKALERQLQEMEEERSLQLERSQRMARLNVELTAKGLTPIEVQDFVKTMSSPESLTLENLVELYRFRKNTSREGAERARKAQTLTTRSNREVPLPASVGGGYTPDPTSEDMAFEQSLMATAKGR